MKKCKVIAIYGDPNTGKSVLTYLLYKDLIRKCVKVFRQEGDPASPTSPWYLECAGEPHTIELRNKLKCPWRPEHVDWIKTSLKNLKSSFDLVLVDLGGGKPPQERVTKEIEEISKEVDCGIILCRKDNHEECEKGWTKELSEKAPNVEIKLKCISDLNGEKAEINSKCIIPGLDRLKVRQPNKETQFAIDKLSNMIIEWIK